MLRKLPFAHLRRTLATGLTPFGASTTWTSCAASTTGCCLMSMRWPATPIGLHALLIGYARYSVLLFMVLLLAGALTDRGGSARTLTAVGWACLATLLGGGQSAGRTHVPRSPAPCRPSTAAGPRRSHHRLLLPQRPGGDGSVSYTHLRAHETRHDLVCRLLLAKKKR